MDGFGDLVASLVGGDARAQRTLDAENVKLAPAQLAWERARSEREQRAAKNGYADKLIAEGVPFAQAQAQAARAIGWGGSADDISKAATGDLTREFLQHAGEAEASGNFDQMNRQLALSAAKPLTANDYVQGDTIKDPLHITSPATATPNGLGKIALDASAALENRAQAGNASAEAALHLAQIGQVGVGGTHAAPSGYRYRDDGGLEFIPGGPADPAVASGNKTKDPTEDQNKAAGWFAQAQNSYDNMEAAIAQDPKADEPNGLAVTLGAIPFIGDTARNAGRNSALTPGQQLYQQAASSFSEAALRAATGAGVNNQEAAQKIAELTPQIGDDKLVRAQKRKSLLVYLDSLKLRAGRALKVNEIPSRGLGDIAAEVAAPPPASAPPEATKTVNGIRYEKHNGQWFEVSP